MRTHRKIEENDYEQISFFPQNEEELFYMFPRAIYPLTVKQLKECASERMQPTVFLSDNKIAGYANIIKVENGNFGVVGNIVVSPQERGKGLGRYILDVMSEKLKENYSTKEIRLACFSNNRSGLILYQKYGFTPYGMEIRSDYNGLKTTLIHLKKEL